jgi:hypothetical protein
LEAKKHDELIEKAEEFKAMVTHDKAWAFFVNIVQKNIEARINEKMNMDAAAAILLDSKVKLARLAVLDVEIRALKWVIAIPEKVILKEEKLSQANKEGQNGNE